VICAASSEKRLKTSRRNLTLQSGDSTLQSLPSSYLWTSGVAVSTLFDCFISQQNLKMWWEYFWENGNWTDIPFQESGHEETVEQTARSSP
jgi:hypothetical protein